MILSLSLKKYLFVFKLLFSLTNIFSFIGTSLHVFSKYLFKVFVVKILGKKPIFKLPFLVLIMSFGHEKGISRISKFFPDSFFA